MMKAVWKPLLIFLGCVVALFLFATYRINVTKPQRAIQAAEELMQQIPSLQDFVNENLTLLTDVQDIFDGVPKLHIRKMDELMVRGEDSTYEAVATSDIFTPENREKILILFSNDNGLLHDYFSNQFMISSAMSDLVDLRLQHITDEDGVSYWTDMSYYFQEVAKDWYVYVTINRSLVPMGENAKRQEDGGQGDGYCVVN